MKLSDLQKYILLMCTQNKSGRISRDRLIHYYDNINKPPRFNIRKKIITRSIERLIEKGLLSGYGEKTSSRTYIADIKLTAQGKKMVKKLQGEQLGIPFKSFKF